MSIVTHSQNFEDVVLWRALGHIENGSYLDIGAQDPVSDSVSLVFYERGWRGLHVEPTAAYAARLREARPDEIVVQAAVSTESGPIQFYEIAETGLSTGVEKIAQRHAGAGHVHRKIAVPTVRLSHLLDQVDEIHWLKIDVEGMERPVLASWDDNPKRPWVLVIEATLPNSNKPTDSEWRSMVEELGYREVHFDGLSRFFLHEAHADLTSSFAAPPNIFDAFQVTERHFAAVALNEELVASRSAIAAAEQERAKLRSELDILHGHIARMQGTLAQTEENRRRSDADRQTAEDRAIKLRDKLTAALEAHVVAERDYRRQLDVAWRERVEIETLLRSETAARIDTEATLKSKSAEWTGTEIDLRSEAAEQAAMRIEATDRSEELARELSRFAERSESADQIIREALAVRPPSWLRLARAIGLTGPDRTAQTLQRWQPRVIEADFNAGTNTMLIASTEIRPNPYLRANSLDELLAWDDIDFVRCAYVTVLGRQPEAKGEVFYAKRLRLGHSKLEILDQLRRSAEARRHDPGIAGFDRALRRARLERGHLGWLVRFYTRGTERDDRWARMYRSLHNDLAVIHHLLGSPGREHLASRSPVHGESVQVPSDGGQNASGLVPPKSMSLSPTSEKAYLILAGLAR